MWSRIALVMAIAFVLEYLRTVHITLPALTIVGVALWAVLATAAAVVLLLRRPAPVSLWREVREHVA